MTVATAAMLARASSPITGRAYRVFVGPQERFIDYALYVTGEPVSLPVEATVTVTTSIGTLPVDLEVDSATGYSNGPSMLFVTSPVSGNAWVRYTSRDSNTFFGCTKVWGQSGGIAAGAKVTQWAEISAQVLGKPTVSRDWTGTVANWSWSIRGEHYNSDLMAPDATILIMGTVAPQENLNQWTDFFLAGLGYVRRWESTGDAQRHRRWSARVESLKTYVDSFQAEGKTFGRVNLAEGQPVTASPNLANPLVLMSLNQPEWRGVIGTTDADKLTDSEIDTGPYVSQVQPSQTPETPGDSNESPVPLIEQVYFGEDGLQFIELRLPSDSPNYNTEGISLSSYALTNSLTLFVDSFGRYPDNHPDHPGDPWPKEIKQGAHNYLRLKDITLSEDNDRIVLTNNRNAFLRRWNVSGNVQVFDWRELPGFGDDGLSGAGVVLDRLGDWLQLRYCAQGIQTVKDMVVWGTPGIPGEPWWNSATDEYESTLEWADSSDRAPLVDAGNSIRRFPVSTDSNGEDEWIEVEAADVNPAERRTDTDPVYISVELADIPTALAEDITTSSHDVGDILPLLEPEYLRVVTAATPLIIRLNSEQMRVKPYQGEWKIVERDYNGTTRANHSADTPVYYLYDGQFIRLPWVQSLEWRRWERFDYVGIGIDPYKPRVPGRWEVWGTREETPRYLDESDYRLDWIGGHALTAVIQGERQNEFAAKATLSTIQPLRHVMMVIKSMTVDNQYAMVNEIRIWRAGLTGTISDYEGIGAVVEHYLAQFPGMSRVVIDEDVFDDTSGDIPITGGGLGRILEDLAESYGFVLDYADDNKLHICRNPFHPRMARPEIFATLTPNMIQSDPSPQRATYPSRVGAGQVEVMLHDVDALRVFRGVYPPSNPFGDIRTIERTMTGGSIQRATEIAQAEYLANPDISSEIELTIFGIFPELRPMQRVLAFNYTDDSDYMGRYEDCLIKGVNGGGNTGEQLLLQVWRQA